MQKGKQNLCKTAECDVVGRGTASPSDAGLRSPGRTGTILPSKLPERKQKGRLVLRETTASQGTRLQVTTLATAVSGSALGGVVLSLELKGQNHQRPPFSPFCPSP